MMEGASEAAAASPYPEAAAAASPHPARGGKRRVGQEEEERVEVRVQHDAGPNGARVFHLFELARDSSYQLYSTVGGKDRKPIFTVGDVVHVLHDDTSGRYQCTVAGFERLTTWKFGAVGTIGMKLYNWNRDPAAVRQPFHFQRSNAEPIPAHLWLSRVKGINHPTDMGVVDLSLDDNGDEYIDPYCVGRLQVSRFLEQSHKHIGPLLPLDGDAALDAYLAWKRRAIKIAQTKKLSHAIIAAAGVCCSVLLYIRMSINCHRNAFYVGGTT
jgi:hypothetical protein